MLFLNNAIKIPIGMPIIQANNTPYIDINKCLKRVPLDSQNSKCNIHKANLTHSLSLLLTTFLIFKIVMFLTNSSAMTAGSFPFPSAS